MTQVHPIIIAPPCEIPEWADRYVGIPWKPRGRDLQGADCWGVVRLVSRERFGLELPELAYETPGDQAAITERVSEQLSASWNAVDPADIRPGDVGLFRILGRPTHVAVMLGRAWMLHALEGVDSCVERVDSPIWLPRFIGAYRHRDANVRVVARTTPFSSERLDLTLAHGLTITEIIARAGIPDSPLIAVTIGDREIRREFWSRTRPHAGRVVRVLTVPQGGGDGGKTALRLVMTIGILAAALAVPFALGGAFVLASGGLSTAGTFLAAGIGIGGTLLVNSLVPPPKPRLIDAATAPVGITGTRNELRPFSPVPQLLGAYRVVPPYLAVPYTENIGDEQYLRCLFGIRGPVEISDIKIGDTPISEFEDVEIQVRSGWDDDPPVTLYPNTVRQLDVQATLDTGWVIRTSDINANELSVDFTFPAGLAVVQGDGDRDPAVVELEVEYRPVGTSTWIRINGSSPDFSRGMDFLFREPEVAFGGEAAYSGPLTWGGGFAGAKPAYLPSTGYSWAVSGWIYAGHEGGGVYDFGVDGSDGCDVLIDDRPVASWYGSHGTQGGGSPNYSGHSGSVFLSRGWHHIRVRVEARTTAGAVSVGWRQPGEGSISPMAAGTIKGAADGSGSPVARWYNTAGYTARIRVEASVTEPLRRTIAWAVATGQYDVRTRRFTPLSGNPSVIDSVAWTTLRTINEDDPVKVRGMAKIALRIRATDQLSGVIDQLNFYGRSILMHWSGTGAPLGPNLWYLAASDNPAAAYRAVMQGSGNARPVADSRLDLSWFQDFSEYCYQEGWSYGALIEDGGTVWDRVSEILAAGRASFAMRDGKFSGVIDRPQSVPVQHFTPRNSRGFRARRAFPDAPHALRITFANRNTGFQTDERIVYADGYDETNATKFDALELPGITDPDAVWRMGRYFLAVAILRPELYELETDVEHLVCNRGDLVLVTHDVPLWGLGFGRVSALRLDGDGMLIGVELDAAVTMLASEQYVIRCRLDDGSSWIKDVTPEDNVTTSVTLTMPIGPGDPRPKVGDLFMFGRPNTETRALIIRAIEMTADLGARLLLVDHAPAVHTADQGAIPPWDPGISLPPEFELRPETPVIASIRSDEFVMIRLPDGRWVPRVVIELRPQSGRLPLAQFAQVRTRVVPDPPAEEAGSFQARPLVPIETNRVAIGEVEQGVTYRIRLRTLTAEGLTSQWVEVVHTVVGTAGLPPDVSSLTVERLSDGTRRFTWALPFYPPDLAGVEIRFGQQGHPWGALTPLHTGLIDASPVEFNEPPAGSWRFGIKAYDAQGNESANALFVDVTLGSPRLDGVVYEEDCAFVNWPGTRADCFINGQNHIEANDSTTWATSPPRWQDWTRWNLRPAPVIVYTHRIVDAGFLADFSPDVYIDADGAENVEVRWSVDADDWSAWTPIAQARTVTVTARFLQARATITATGDEQVPYIRGMVVRFRAETAFWYHDNLNTAGLPATHRLGVGDVRLPVPAGMFAFIQSIVLGFNQSGPGWTYEVVDKDVDLGPRVRIYNRDGVLADAVIDAAIRGLRNVDGAVILRGDGSPAPWYQFNLDFNSQELAL